MNKKLIAIIGALAVVIGAFCPLFTVPIIGSISYAGQIQGEGMILAGAAIVSILFCLNNIYTPSFITGLLVLGDAGWTLCNFFNRVNLVSDENPLARALIRTVSPSFGFAILIIGAGMLITSVCWKEETTEQVWDKTRIYTGANLPIISKEEEQAREEQFKKTLARVSLKSK